MSMFCYQCQETARGTGCTIKGVCGKTEDVANLQDLLIFVLKGISIYSTKAREKGVEDNEVNKFVFDSLFTTITNANFDKKVFFQRVRKG
ncbi:MAG: hydroxylamine reductase, partial [Bacteroidales bacterium]